MGLEQIVPAIALIAVLILILPYLAWSFYLLFGNSKAKKHIG